MCMGDMLLGESFGVRNLREYCQARDAHHTYARDNLAALYALFKILVQ